MASIVFEATDGVLSVMEFDATVSEMHSLTAIATTHPIEKGSSVTDFVKPDQVKVSLVGCVTNSPVQDTWRDQTKLPVAAILLEPKLLTLHTFRSKQLKYANVKGGYPRELPAGFRIPFVKRDYVRPAATMGQRINEAVTATGNVLSSSVEVDRVKECFDQLLLLVGSGTKVSLITDLRQYENMVITSVTAPRDAPNDAMMFQIELTEVTFANARVVGFSTPKAPTPADKRNQQVIQNTAAPEIPPPDDPALVSHAAGILADALGKSDKSQLLPTPLPLQ